MLHLTHDSFDCSDCRTILVYLSGDSHIRVEVPLSEAELRMCMSKKAHFTGFHIKAQSEEDSLGLPSGVSDLSVLYTLFDKQFKCI